MRDWEGLYSECPERRAWGSRLQKGRNVRRYKEWPCYKVLRMCAALRLSLLGQTKNFLAVDATQLWPSFLPTLCIILSCTYRSNTGTLFREWGNTTSYPLLCAVGNLGTSPPGHLGRISAVSEEVTNFFTTGTDGNYFRVVSVWGFVDATRIFTGLCYKSSHRHLCKWMSMAV